jgi:hypothetical protein
MPIECEVVARPGARAAELKALGSALLRWYVRECGDGGVAHSVDTEALIELLNGRPPAPRVPRPAPARVPPGADDATPPLGGYELPAFGTERLREALPQARRPAVLLRVRAGNYDRARAVASLRRHVPAALVADVRLDGRSWDIE